MARNSTAPGGPLRVVATWRSATRVEMQVSLFAGFEVGPMEWRRPLTTQAGYALTPKTSGNARNRRRARRAFAREVSRYLSGLGCEVLVQFASTPKTDPDAHGLSAASA